MSLTLRPLPSLLLRTTLVFVMFGAFGFTPAHAKEKEIGVRAMFQNAQLLYDQKNYIQALAAYASILKKYPGHEPSTIQMAKTYYRVERLKDSYTMFSRVNPQFLDPETGFEYGMSFYQAKQWEGALRGFERVPAQHSLGDLASYYGGVSAIKLRKFELAEELLERAVVLPEKLAKSRKLYQKHLASLRLMRQKSELEQAKKNEKQRLKDAAAAADAKNKTPAASQAEAGSTYVHKGMFSIRRSARADFLAERTEKDYFGRRTDSAEILRRSISFANGLQWSFGDKEQRPTLGIPFTVRGEFKSEKGEEERFITRERTEDIVERIIDQKDIENSKKGQVTVGPWFEFPITEAWLALGAEFFLEFPDFESGERNGSRKVFGSVGGKPTPFEFNVQLSTTEFFDAENKAEYAKTGASGSVDMSLINAIGVGVDASYSLFEYLVEDIEIDGPDATTSLGGRVYQGLPFGFEIGAGAFFEQNTNFKVFGIESFGALTADNTVTGGNLYISAAPLKFITAKVEGLRQQTNWRVDRPEAQETFEKSVPDYLAKFGGSIGLNLAF